MRRRLKRATVIVVIAAQVIALTSSVERNQAGVARASVAAPCGNGADGAAPTFAGPVDTYWTPPTGTLAANANTISLGTIDTAGGGASTGVKAGDELLIIQMQDGTFNDTNSTAYGDGASGSGYTSLSSAGSYEYVRVDASVAGTKTTGTISIDGAGIGFGLLYSYHEAAATGSTGVETYQIIRVPQYTTATLNSAFTAAYWDGTTGGVAALDVASTLNLGGASVYATADGFRGGGVTIVSNSPSGWSSGDYAESSSTQTPPADGSKGEGIMGTQKYKFQWTNFANPAAPTSPTIFIGAANGYPGGDQARGAPGNAGGGGTDEDPVSNDQNDGGGGGGNGGAGGNGGYPWTPQYTNGPVPTPAAGYPLYTQYPFISGTQVFAAGNFHDLGGRGGGAISPGSIDATRAFMGGGGGAGSNNDGSNDNAYGKYGSSGGPGGGIILMRIAQTSGSAATLHADGAVGLDPNQDGGGGGGAGGEVIVTSPGAFSGIGATAEGASGTTTWLGTAGAVNQHGPGGGGGGGIILSTSAMSSTNVSGGPAGLTTTGLLTYGATDGSSGVVSTINATDIPGVQSGAECYSTTGVDLYTGPYDTAEATYKGADETGSFDGSVTASNNNDFTSVSVPTSTTITNTGTVAGSPVGNTVTPTTPHAQAVNELYYDNTTGGKRVLTLTDTAPSGWTVQLCGGSAAAPTCGTTTTVTCGNNTGWVTGDIDVAASATATAEYCVKKNVTVSNINYWAIYTPPATLMAYQRYDAAISLADDDGTPPNSTHNELYPGFVPITKNVSVISTGCPAGVLPTYPALGVCPGGYLLYTIDYRNIIAGGGSGNEPLAAMATAGTLNIIDDGLQSTASQNATPNWGTFSNGVAYALTNNLGANNALCSLSHSTDCGDSNAATTYRYYTTTPIATACTAGGSTVYAAGKTGWCALVGGGGTFKLYPIGVTGQESQGTITFAVQVK